MVSHEKPPTDSEDEPSTKRQRSVEAPVVVQKEEKEPMLEEFQPKSIPELNSIVSGNGFASDMEMDGREPVAQDQIESEDEMEYDSENGDHVENGFVVVPSDNDQMEDDVESNFGSEKVYDSDSDDSDDDMVPEPEDEDEVVDLTAPVKNDGSFEYDDHRCNLWPAHYEVIQQLKRDNELNEKYLLKNMEYHIDFMDEYETAIDFLIGMTKPAEPNTEEELQNFRIYWYRREKLILYSAKKTHKINETRPGFEHHYGFLFPAKFTYDMVEFMIANIPQLGYRVPNSTSIGNVDYPEFHEVKDHIRIMMEQSISSDPEPDIRLKMINMVAALDGFHDVTDNRTENYHALDAIIREMNFLFSINFECYIINKARRVLKKHDSYQVDFTAFNRKIRFRETRYEAFLNARNNENMNNLAIQQNLIDEPMQQNFPNHCEMIEIANDHNTA